MRYKEQKLQNQISDYLKMQYPKVMFMISPSGFNNGQRNGAMLKRQQNPTKGWPDIYIMQVSKKEGKVLAGLFIELKSDTARVFKKDGTLVRNEHLEIQNNVHHLLRKRGYFAVFSQGFEETKKLIDWYLNADDDRDNIEEG